MTRSNTVILLLLGTVTLLWVSGGSAQQDSVGGLNSVVRQDDLDSYWLDTQQLVLVRLSAVHQSSHQPVRAGSADVLFGEFVRLFVRDERTSWKRSLGRRPAGEVPAHQVWNLALI